MSNNPWTAFWEQEQTGFFRIMEKSTLASARKMEKFGLIKKGTRVLDYGCGPGFFLDFCASREVEGTGADINPFFIECCKKKYPTGKFSLLPSAVEKQAAELEKVFAAQKFDIILLLSVAQYFEGAEHLKEVVSMLKKYLNKNGKIILADIVTAETSGLRDALALGVLCVRYGMAVSFVRFFLHLFFSRYRQASKTASLHHYTDNNIDEIAKSLGMTCEKAGTLTIHPTRSNYVLSEG